MSQQEKPMKISKHLRLKAQDFLNSRKCANNLVEIVKHLDSGLDTSACLLTLDMIFNSVLKSRDMYLEIVPLKGAENTVDNMYKKWLLNIYEEVLEKVLYCIQNSSNKVQIQALTTALNLLSNEGKFPLESKPSLIQGVPLIRLKNILSKLLHTETNSALLLNKFEEYLLHNDVLLSTWKILPKITLKSNPSEQYILNYLNLLEKMPLEANEEVNLLCENPETFNFDLGLPRKNLNKVWNCVMLWQHSVSTHKQLLILLLEKVLSNLDKPLLLTDFLMDSLDVGGPVSLLALQGIFTLIQVHNLDYPNIYSKLYSMFEPEIFHTKYKSRLFHLSDLFLSSTHLPETLVAAFAKRLARLALLAPPLDATIICMFIGNLILRHPGLKTLIHTNANNIAHITSHDPYIMDESDPVKSNAINSSLWEIRSLQQHVLPSVAEAAAFINKPLPKVEFDMHKYLNLLGGDDVFDREIKRNRELVALAIAKPISGGGENSNDLVGQYFIRS